MNKTFLAKLSNGDCFTLTEETPQYDIWMSNENEWIMTERVLGDRVAYWVRAVIKVNEKDPFKA